MSATETLAEHSHRTSVIGAALAALEGADPARTTLLCTLHEVPEARTGDLSPLTKRYVTAADKLDCLLRALEYRAGGVPAVQGKIDRCRAALTTVAAQRIADAAPALDPTDWQYTWTSRSDVTAAEVSVSARLEAGQAAVADRLVVMVSAYELKCSHVRTNVQSCLQRPRGDAGSARHEEECSA